MLIKHLVKFAAMAIALCLWSCNDDDLPANEQNVEEQSGFYATVTLQLPTATGSRSQTVEPNEGNDPAQSSDGYEEGSAGENTVTTVAVVLAGKNEDGTYTKIATGSTESPLGNTTVKNLYTLKFRSSDLIEYYTSQPNPSNKLYIFCYCNVGVEFREYLQNTLNFNPHTRTNLSAALADAKIEITPATPQVLQSPVIRNSISQVNNFLMTNADLPSYDGFMEMTPDQIIAELKKHNKPGNALALTTTENPVKVERLACRFDYQHNGPFNVEFDNEVYASISIEGLALFNEAKKFYFFPHMTPINTSGNAGEPAVNGTTVNPEKFTLCGNEFGNYIGSPYWETMLNDATTNQQLAELFNYPTALEAAPSSFTYTPVNAIINSDEDNDGSTQTPTWPAAGTDYHIWRYATENTIPTVSGQKNGVSTGIYFRCKLNPASDEYLASNPLAQKIRQAMIDGVPIYAYSENVGESQNNTADIYTLIGSAQELFILACSDPTSVIAMSFLQGFKYGLFSVMAGNTPISAKDLDLNDIDNTIPPGLFTTSNVVTTVASMKQETNSKELPNATGKYLNDIGLYAYWTRDNSAANGNPKYYYCYYPYYNRHNDNDDNGNMGPMEFATVRNNVYKIKVKNITRLGLPSDVPPDPNTPDESEDVYIEVDVKILDWVVRLNDNIIF